MGTIAHGLAEAAAGINIASALITYAKDPTSNGNKARLVVQGIAAAANFIPVYGWGISLGITLLDATVGDKFYYWLDKKKR